MSSTPIISSDAPKSIDQILDQITKDFDPKIPPHTPCLSFDPNTARKFNCQHCYCLVIICRCCDRGNIYCPDCHPEARQRAQKKADYRYNHSLKGQLTRAQYQRQYRDRLKQSIDHPPPPQPPDTPQPTASRSSEVGHDVEQGSQPQTALAHCADLNKNQWTPGQPRCLIRVHCHFCKQACADHVRTVSLAHNQYDSTY